MTILVRLKVLLFRLSAIWMVAFAKADLVLFRINLPGSVQSTLNTVRLRGMETGISEASKRVPSFSFATQGGKQASFHFRHTHTHTYGS